MVATDKQVILNQVRALIVEIQSRIGQDVALSVLAKDLDYMSSVGLTQLTKFLTATNEWIAANEPVDEEAAE